jgi:DNA polymerase-3 subunit chi
VTRVDFYVLGERARGDRFQLACRLTEKAWQRGHRVCLYTGSAAESEHLDRLLWTFRQASFIPHGIAGESDPEITPILITHEADRVEEQDLLINLSTGVPEFFSHFNRLAELIDHDGENRRLGRERYRFYRDRGYPLNNHEIEK